MYEWSLIPARFFSFNSFVTIYRLLYKIHPILFLLQVSSLPVEPDCTCTGGFSRVNGVNFNVNCQLSEPVCIDPPTNLQCGTFSFVGQYNRRGTPSTTTLTIDGGVYSLGLLQDPPPITIALTHARPVVYSDPIQLTECAASAQGNACTSCEICGNGKSFKFDCSNIEATTLLGVIKVPLPNVEECIGLSS